jgi:hypothetical protein
MPHIEIWQNPNGTWSHHRDSKREWREREACATDLRFATEWQRSKAEKAMDSYWRELIRHSEGR